METAAGDGAKASFHTFIHLITDKAGPKTLRTVKFKVVGFRLGMLVGQITGPVAWVVQDFAQYHVGLRGDIVVENSIYPTISHIAEFALAGISPGSILGRVKAAGEMPLIFGGLNQNF